MVESKVSIIASKIFRAMSCYLNILAFSYPNLNAIFCFNYIFHVVFKMQSISLSIARSSSSWTLSSQRSNTWCIPSFDCESVNKPVAKRTNRAKLDKTLSDRSFTQSNFKRRKHETSLSKLLQACEPQKSFDLAISKQKQNEISNWLQCKALKGQPSMLILSGPSGCGKTAALKLLAKENAFDVIEWITPVDPAEDENSNNRRFKFKLLHNMQLNF